jgi:pimeloyl-ACP methyl ester carboxylesterase
MKKLVASIAIASVVLSGSFAMAAEPTKPTVVSIHGAFANNSSWNGVVKILQKDGYTAAAASNPLRSVKGDADDVANIVAGIKTPVVLVGHSYGGSVISEAAFGKANVKALAFVSAFAPEAGETAVGLSGKLPGGTLGPMLAARVTSPLARVWSRTGCGPRARLMVLELYALDGQTKRDFGLVSL